jgi:membrane-bound lytic murein transglycosylase B
LAREKSEAAARKASEHKVRKYISNMVSRDRVERGASLLLKHAGILGEVEREYGVPGEIIVAIWGIESSFGGFSGNTDCVEALANIAWRRGVSGDVTDAAYFRNELIEATRIVDKGLGVNTTETGENTKEPDGSNAFRVFKRRVALVGSWDGGLGQCQFMPSNYHVYAVDKDGDGAADIWNSLPDVFASMGNFISKYCEWDKSVRAAGFGATFENDASLKKLAAADAIGGFWAERRAWRPAKFFAWNGLRTTHREHAPVPSSETLLLMPDGAESVSSLAFLATANFRALMRYNPSTQYAMAVSTLAQEIVDEAAEITARRAREEKAREAEKVKAAEATKKGKSSLPQTSQNKTDA